MAFVAARKTYRLEFDDPAMDGAEVVCRGISMGRYFELAQLRETDGTQAAEKLLRGFGEDVLVEWNLTDDNGEPIPATVDGLFGLESWLAMKIVLAWVDAMVNISGPLGETSGAGGQSEEA